jgi:hypothetical protein
MDFKSFLIGFLLALLMFLLVGAGGNGSSRYQIRDENSASATIIDTSTGIAKKIQKGRVVETYNFNADAE